MSVINQMLKDLEKRRQNGTEGDVLDGLSWNGNSAARRRLPVLAVIVVLLALVIAWLLYDRPTQLVATANKENTPVSLAEAERPPVEPVAVEPGVIEKKPVVAAPQQQTQAGQEKPAQEKPEAQQAALAAVVADSTTVNEAGVAQTPLVISAINPASLPANGQRQRLRLQGSGFIEPLTVVLAWNAGKTSKQLTASQVHVESESQLSLFFNPGTSRDNWKATVTNAQGQTVDASFTVEPVGQQQAQDTPASHFTKTVRQPAPAQQAAGLFNDARSALARGALADGESLLRKALEKAPGLHAARKLLAGLLLREKRNGEAAKVLDDGLALQAADTDFLLLRAQLYAGESNMTAAIRLLESQKPLLQQAPDYYALLSALYQRSGQHQQAAELYSAMLRLNPSQALWNMGLGISLEALGDRQGAREAYQRALQSGLKNEDVASFVRKRLQAL